MTRRAGADRRFRSSSRLLLLVILLVAGALRFHRLDWNDHGLPHPDERAVASQTHDMLVRDDYRPTIHTWGHAGYYSTLFAYKTWLWLQNGWTFPADGEPLTSDPGGPVPPFREIVAGAGEVPLGLLVVLSLWIVYGGLARLASRPRLAAALAAAGALALALAWPGLHERMLWPVRSNYEDVIHVGRFLSALASTLTVGLVYSIGARLYRPAVGLLAAAFLAVSVVPIQLAHFYIVDPVQAFAVVLALWVATMLCGARLRDQAELPWSTLGLYVALGGAVGLAMASKFSSAPILVLPLVTHLLLLRHMKSSPLVAAIGLVASYVAALGVWYALEPYAWENPFVPVYQAAGMGTFSERWLHLLFSQEFAQQISEQSRMVRGRAGGPWVQQFATTTPWLTLTVQMVRFSFGWPLGLLAVGGLAWIAISNLKRPRATDLLLLSWAGVLYLILGSFKATFTRYTAPLLPFVCLFAALLCLGRVPSSRRAGRIAAAVAIAGALFYSLAFLSIYERPHAWTTASLWIYKNVPLARPDGTPTRIAHEQWDDTIPLHVPPHDASDYGSVDMAPYHGDGREKLLRLAQWLEDADWICLPTTRLYGTILTVPDTYPFTVRYYKALFGGTLGFTLRRTVWEQPRLLGIAIDDMVGADESHYIYDHPKAVLFEKTERLDAAELARRIERLPPEVEALTRADLLRFRESTAEQVRNLVRDPYLDEGVVERREVEARVRAAGLDPESAQAYLAAVEAREPSVPALDATAVRDLVDRAAAQPDRAAISGLRERLETLASRPAYGVGELRDVVDSTVTDPGHRERLHRSLGYDVTDAMLSRAAVFDKLDRVDVGVGGLPAHAPRAAAPSGGDGRRVEVVARGGKLGQIGAVLAWILVLEALGLAALPWALQLFPALPGTGWAIAKTLGLVLASYFAWLVVNLGIGELGMPMAWAAVALLAIACWAPPSARRRLRERLPGRRLLIASELLFVGAFVAFALVRAFNPEIFWGEKPMDFSLLNGMLRTGSMPPFEPWFSGVVLNYYYYGFVLVAFLTMLVGTPSAIAFNLANAVVPALALVGAFGLAYALTRRVRWGLLGAALYGVLGNLDWLHQLVSEGHIADAWSERAVGASSLLDRLLLWAKAPWFALTMLLEPGRASLWDSYWATSRALGEGMINEYPVWSWLFADLHAHVMVMPVSLLALAILYAVFVDQERAPDASPRDRFAVSRLARWGLLALLLGMLLATNTWDLLVFAGLVPLVLAAAALGRWQATPATGESAPSFVARPAVAAAVAIAMALAWPLVGRLHPYWLGLFDDWWIGLLLGVAVVGLTALGRRPVVQVEQGVRFVAHLVRRAVVPAALVFGAGAIAFIHFQQHLDTGGAALHWNRDGFITAWHALRHFGLFAMLTLTWVAAVVARPAEAGIAGSRKRSAALLVAAAVASFLLVPMIDRLEGASGFTVYLFLLLAVTVAATHGRLETAESRFAAVLLAAGWGVAAVSEMVVLTDRMNTVFKLYHPAWMLIALGLAGSLGPILDRGAARWRAPRADGAGLRPRVVPAAVSVVLLAAIGVAAVCTWRAVTAVVTLERRVSDRPTLDGLDFLRHGSADDAELLESVTWLDAHTRGPQVTAEAFTNRGYDESARVAQYTGLPILLGWPHHIKQRGRTEEQLEQRAVDLMELYTSPDAATVAEICRRYGIRWVFVGELERARYRDPDARFSSMPFLRPAFHSSGGAYAVYEVAGAPSAAPES